ncbi:MAG: rod shape-determining protein RodA [Candidatus Accumulibacter sp.]|jgi:rod shape determining protein RodA|nr:rod shape-determining protein RodA [Accumulibacter sp.]
MPQLFQRLRNSVFEYVDFPLLVITMLLMTIGLLTVFSATYDKSTHAFRQMASMFVGLAVMWGVARIHPQRLMRFAAPLYIAGLALLVLVVLTGVRVNGARRWLSLGVVRIQPSEIFKIVMPMMLAWYFQKYEDAIKMRHYVAALLMLAVPFLLIARQPDLGTAILIGAAGFYVVFFAGIPWKFLTGMLIAGAVAFPFVWPLLHEFQRKRILMLFDPMVDPLGAGYHIIQSSIAIGSGGFFGKGWLRGTQTYLEFIPEPHTDFIFSVFSEEQGFLGVCVLILLYLLLIVRCLVIASEAPTFYTRLLGGALTMSFFTYPFVNIGMVSGILPVVGIPLPFMSYGGTALVILFCSLGILMGIRTHPVLLRR